MTPLAEAVSIAAPKCTVLLLAAGADVNISDTKGCTVLHKAAANGSITTLKMLIKAGGSLYGINGEGDNVLDIINKYRPAKAGYIEDLIRMEERAMLKRLKNEDKTGAAVTGYEFDI